MSIELLHQLASLLSESGDPCNYGCEESEVERVLLGLTQKPKRIRVVKNWVSWKLNVSDFEAIGLDTLGLKNMMIYGTIAYDSIDKWSPGLSVRSTLLVDFREGCIFETKNTNYILLGSGTIKSLDPNAALSICF